MVSSLTATLPVIDLKAIQATFENALLAALKYKELIDDGTIAQILLTSHLFLPYESTTRYFGAWSCRTRGELAKKYKLLN